MADLSARLDNVVVGDDFDIERLIDNVPIGETIVQAWMTVKEDFWDNTFIFQKEISGVGVPTEGVILDTDDSDEEATLTFYLMKEDTILLHEFFEYCYDIQVKTSGGRIYTPEVGVFVPSASVTDQN